MSNSLMRIFRNSVAIYFRCQVLNGGIRCTSIILALALLGRDVSASPPNVFIHYDGSLAKTYANIVYEKLKRDPSIDLVSVIDDISSPNDVAVYIVADSDSVEGNCWAGEGHSVHASWSTYIEKYYVVFKRPSGTKGEYRIGGTLMGACKRGECSGKWILSILTETKAFVNPNGAGQVQPSDQANPNSPPQSNNPSQSDGPARSNNPVYDILKELGKLGLNPR